MSGFAPAVPLEPLKRSDNLQDPYAEPNRSDDRIARRNMPELWRRGLLFRALVPELRRIQPAQPGHDAHSAGCGDGRGRVVALGVHVFRSAVNGRSWRAPATTPGQPRRRTGIRLAGAGDGRVRGSSQASPEHAFPDRTGRGHGTCAGWSPQRSACSAGRRAAASTDAVIGLRNSAGALPRAAGLCGQGPGTNTVFNGSRPPA